jgi:hypothetical protein
MWKETWYAEPRWSKAQRVAPGVGLMSDPVRLLAAFSLPDEYCLLPDVAALLTADL